MPALQIPEATRQLVLDRDMRCCLRCGRWSVQIHHRKARGRGGSRDPRINDPRNLVVLCGSGTTGCHHWVHQHPARARELGWMLLSLDDLDRPIRHLGWIIELTELGSSRYRRAELGSDSPPPREERS